MSSITWEAADIGFIATDVTSDHVADFVDSLNILNLTQYNGIVNNFDRILDLILCNDYVSVSSGATGVNAPARGAAGEVAVTALALAPGTHRLYTAAGDKLRLWDLRMLECVSKMWSGHAAAVMCLAAAARGGGDLLCTGSKDHYVRAAHCAPTHGLCQQCLECVSKMWSGHCAAVMCMAAAARGGGDLLCTGSKDHYVRAAHCAPTHGSWDVGARRLLEPPHYDGVQALALCGDTLYSASRDSSLKRWSLTDNCLTHGVMNAHKGWVTGVASIGDDLLATCGRDAAVRLWDTQLRPAARAAAAPHAAHALASHPDPQLMTIYTAGKLVLLLVICVVEIMDFKKMTALAAATCACGAWATSAERRDRGIHPLPWIPIIPGIPPRPGTVRGGGYTRRSRPLLAHASAVTAAPAPSLRAARPPPPRLAVTSSLSPLCATRRRHCC
ncbi:unnamed protein product [Plutella xylostella]|uniref:(diamondback moth) hypothetical protein n=1 Tax=Plutella xylostella TaxID=51655 RepID=A0A8S4G439_PLUXY|nr:unnamed protein product [Plutella xylostella]